MKYRHPLDPDAHLRPLMTITVDLIESIETRALGGGEGIARLDLTIARRKACGSLYVKDMPRVDLGAGRVEEDDGAWEVFVKLLAGVGEAGFASEGLQSPCADRRRGMKQKRMRWRQ